MRNENFVLGLCVVYKYILFKYIFYLNIYFI